MSRSSNSPMPSPAHSGLSDYYGQNVKDQTTENSFDPDLHQSPLSLHSRNDGAMSESDSDVEIRRPLGRAARRMLESAGNTAPNPLLHPERSSLKSTSQGNPNLITPRQDRTPLMHVSKSPSGDSTESTLFVSPTNSSDAAREERLALSSLNSKSRLAALVEEKRAERLAREAQEGQRVETGVPEFPEDLLEDPHAPVNEDIERLMSDAARPTRKASKKALLDMERETQRIARQQALAHQMKVRKKFTTSDLFARFNFHPNGMVTAHSKEDSDGSSCPNSEAAEHVEREPVSTPPSSPPTPFDKQSALVDKGALSKMMPVRENSLTNLSVLVESDGDCDQDLPKVATVIKTARDTQLSQTQPASMDNQPKKGLKLARLGKKAISASTRDDSGDELEIVQDYPNHLIMFEKAKGTMKREQTDSKAIHTLKHLAHLGTDRGVTSRSKKASSRPSVNPQFLEAQLRSRAKEQARAQQLERIAELKAKGIEVQTTEEREREQEAFESLLEKARQEAAELRKAEKAASKSKGVDAQGNEIASDDESEDEEYIDESGSDVEEGADLIDRAAEETDDHEEESESDDEDEAEDDDDDDDLPDAEVEIVEGTAQHEARDQNEHNAGLLETPSTLHPRHLGRKSRASRIIIDEDDDSDVEPSQRNGLDASVDEDAAEEDDPFAAFKIDVGAARSSLMSPTQMFNATMQTPTQATQSESLNVLQYLVPPSSASLPPLSPIMHLQTQTQGDSQVDFVPNSQISGSQAIDLVWETKAPETPIPGQSKGGSQSETPGWQPTQDAGLPNLFHRTPTFKRSETFESITDLQTQSTVRLRISESPVARQDAGPERRRLARGQRPLVQSSDEEDASVTLKQGKKDAFREMARKRREALSAAELAEAEKEAKKMMDEQAEESEDEYAGLGGDDYIAPETDQDRAMIDSSLIDVDERELAALHAERQRVADEAAANKLYKDLTTGALRRKQANAFDLDEDEDDLAVRRRQMRQREEARKRKLLLQDDNIAGLAEGRQSKGKDAFLKAIADDDDRDEEALDLSDVDDEVTPATQTDSQTSQQVFTEAEALREVSGNKRRIHEMPEDRPPAKQRRTKASAFRAPTSLLEVKESVSFLLEETHAAPVGPSILDFDSESDRGEQDGEEGNEDDDELQAELDRRNDGGFAPDQVAMPPPRLPASQRRTAAQPSVVDRLLLKRGSSASDNALGRTAWAASGTAGFQVPSLLRRATTNTGLAANERGVTTSNGGTSRENSGGVKMGGSKKSNLAYQARAEERRAIVEASSKRRAENTARIAQLRRAASSGFGKGLSGTFE